ncbi:unnamed protein product [Urochloa humidicola]
MAMPPGHMFGVPMPAGFAHHMAGAGAAPPEQMEANAAAAPAREGAEHTPVPVVTTGRSEADAASEADVKATRHSTSMFL